MSKFRSTDDYNELFDGIGGAEHPELVDPDPHRLHIISSPGDAQIEDERRDPGVFRSDWDAMVERHEKAVIGPRGEMLDDFDQNFQIKEAEHGELHQQAAFTRDNPPSIVTASLGNTVQVPPGRLVVAARWDGQDPETGPVTITLGPIALPVLGISGNIIQAGGPAYRARARITWGTKTSAFHADVDIGPQGCQFTINASSVVVELYVDTNIPATSQPLALTAQISFKPCVRFAPLTYTLYHDGITAGASAFFNVPAYAKSFKVQRPGSTNGQLMDTQIILRDQAATAIVNYDFATVATGFEPLPVNDIPLPGDAAYIEVFNNGGQTQPIRLICTLGI